MRRPQPNARASRHVESTPTPTPRRTRPPEYSTRSAAVLVLAIAALMAAFGSQTVSPALPPSHPTVPGSEVALLPSPTSAIDLVVSTAVPTQTMAPPTATISPTVEPTALPTLTLAPTVTPTPEIRPTVPPSGNDTESVIFERGNPNTKQIAFTFDAGEGPGYVTQILDLFKQYGIHGTFGVTGVWAEQNPDLIKRMVDEGHLIINHTLNHKSFSGYSTGAPALTDQERTDEIVQANDAIVAAGGEDTHPFFRFPYNDYDEQALLLLKQLGYDYTLGYTCDTLAWNGNSADQIIQLCGPDAPKGGPGGIILMHVVQEQDFLALEPLIQAYLDAGYEIVTMDVMIGS